MEGHVVMDDEMTPVKLVVVVVNPCTDNQFGSKIAAFVVDGDFPRRVQLTDYFGFRFTEHVRQHLAFLFVELVFGA